MFQRRPPAPQPHIPYCPRKHILFRHPGYDDSNNVLIKLYAFDADEHGRPGLYAQLALDACNIITGNCGIGGGWLSELRTSTSPRIDADSTLCESSYYFHLDDWYSANNEPYAVVPDFREWRYPHHRVPLHWRRMALAADMGDRSCRLSGCREQAQVAHLVPQAELEWWSDNSLGQYNEGPAPTIDDTANALLLRADLRLAFGQPRFALVPKPAKEDPYDVRLIAHLLDYSPELAHFYHNREVRNAAVGVEMLYARFAWSVFPLLDAFFQCEVDRRVALCSSTYEYDRRVPTAEERGVSSAAAARKRKVAVEAETVSPDTARAKRPTLSFLGLSHSSSALNSASTLSPEHDFHP